MSNDGAVAIPHLLVLIYIYIILCFGTNEFLSFKPCEIWIWLRILMGEVIYLHD